MKCARMPGKIKHHEVLIANVPLARRDVSSITKKPLMFKKKISPFVRISKEILDIMWELTFSLSQPPSLLPLKD